jgi:hypothetical protein
VCEIGISHEQECACPPFIPGDFDRDGDVDGTDFGLWQLCSSGLDVLADPGCISYQPHLECVP